MSVAGVDTPSSISAFAARLAQASDAVTFEDTMEVIAANYEFAPKPFTNGDVHNAAGTNEGSCKVFSFGKLAALDEASTLSCFGQHYRDVLADPAGAAHANIRSFMEAGWGGVHFPEGVALTPK
ncbi:HopJ type III effector protein [Tribonema minus]|uniref:HopJ type III effector protein n=1 Tax=Tribonema minus TaxID=303371 RepID=A0A835YL21_9STRA|nr:HopJ type III effector protein [Tribonema minus]